MTEPEHSPKGASSAERWMNCPGSGVILDQLKLPQSDDAEYRQLGKAAHELARVCLVEGVDTWEKIGEVYEGVAVDANMSDAVQTYLDKIASLREPGATELIEQKIGEDPALRPHPQFYGRVDWAQYGTDVLDVVDYKHGEGIVVEPKENAQMMYYAYGIIHQRTARGIEVRSDRVVRLTIVQPRAFHEDGPVRDWETTAGEIIYWGENVLIPAMERAEFDTTLDAGPHCRFCPAKLFCPLMQSIFGAAMKADASVLPNFGQKRIGLEYSMIPQVEMYIKAVKDEALRRGLLGNPVPGTKIVHMKARSRVFHETTELEINGAKKVVPVVDVLKASFGDAIFTKPELKSPSQIEELGPVAKKLVKEYAYLPTTGLTVAKLSDKRAAVRVDKATDVFAHLIETNGD
jgi:hypothetical protein